MGHIGKVLYLHDICLSSYLLTAFVKWLLRFYAVFELSIVICPPCGPIGVVLKSKKIILINVDVVIFIIQSLFTSFSLVFYVLITFYTFGAVGMLRVNGQQVFVPVLCVIQCSLVSFLFLRRPTVSVKALCF